MDIHKVNKILFWDQTSFKSFIEVFFLKKFLTRQKDAQHFNLIYDIVLFCGDYV